MIGPKTNHLIMDSRAGQRFTKGKKTRYGHDVDTISNVAYVAHQKRTDYAATLIDPFLRINARIPDLSCYPTATYRTEFHQVVSILNAASNENTKMLVVDLHPDSYLYYYQGEGGVGPGALRNTSSSVQISSTVSTKYKAARLVSAMMKVSYAGNDTTTEGAITGAYFPSDWQIQGGYPFDSTGPDTNSNPDICYTAAKWLNCPDYYSGPMKNGVVLRMKPQDIDNFNMRQISVDDPLTTPTTTRGSPFGAFIVYVDPTVTTAIKFQVDIVLNWEGIIKTNDAGVPIGISGADPGALAHGINAAGASATAFSATSASWAKHVDQVLRSVA